MAEVTLLRVISAVVGMMFEKLLPEVGAVEMEIKLGRGYRLMAKHFLYGAQVGSPFEKMGGKRVAESVGADLLAIPAMAARSRIM